MDKTEAIEKIRKLFALGQSSNEKESAAATRKAYALMRKYKLSMNEIFETSSNVPPETENRNYRYEETEVNEEEPRQTSASSSDQITLAKSIGNMFVAGFIVVTVAVILRGGINLIGSGIQFIKGKTESTAGQSNPSSSVQQPDVAPQTATSQVEEKNELPNKEDDQQTLPAASAQVFETTRTIFVRAGPGNQFRIVARIPAGVRVNVVGRQGSWLEIVSKHGNPPGYINGSYDDLRVPETNGTERSTLGEENNTSEPEEARF